MQPSTAKVTAATEGRALRPLHRFRNLRALAWHGDVLFASQGYSLLQAQVTAGTVEWEIVGSFRPEFWRALSTSNRLSFRLFREGFHALAILPTGHIIAAVPGVIITLAPGETEFRVSHRIERGTRPLHIASTPNGRLFWGEYFDNRDRDEVHIYGSHDGGLTWDVAYTFIKGTVRHVHNIVYDQWEDCLWILMGDYGTECQILRASLDLRAMDVVLSGTQQARAAALIPMRDAIYFSSDTPLESNHIYRLTRNGAVSKVANIAGPSIYGCRVGNSLLFSTMVEPRQRGMSKDVTIYRSNDGLQWNELLRWKKDFWPMRLFQYGNAFLPDGNNESGLLAVSTLGVIEDDLATTIWRI